MKIVLITNDEFGELSTNLDCSPGDCSPVNLDCSPGDCSPVNACNPDYEITKVKAE